MKRWIILFSVALCLVGIVQVLATDTSVEAFLAGSHYNRLVEDSEFIDYSSMNVASIQQFLENRSSYLAVYSQGGQSAAQIIWEAAMGISPDSQGTLYGIVIDETTGTINPMAILVTLQKEQSLIGKSYYDEYGLDWAMGYDYPNTTYIGFTTQIGWGAWQLRHSFERAVKDWATTYHVGMSDWYDSSYGAIYVTYTNQSTASLYRYTPHIFDGNYNFWKLYSDWFYSIGQAKLKNDGTAINLFHKPVVFVGSDYFYIEEKDRSCGLRIAKAGHGLTAGMCTDVYGAIYTNPYGERYIMAEAVVQNGTGVVEALRMPNRNLGGSGLSNVGLKVRLCGRVSSINSAARTFLIRDGSGYAKVLLAQGLTLPLNNTYVAVTGISSYESPGQPMLLGFEVTTY